MKIAVLGATGLLGHHTARAIRAAGHELVLIHHPDSRIERLGYLDPELRSAALFDHPQLSRALADLDGVVFCPDDAPARHRRWQDAVASALDETNHFYADCLSAHVPRILHVGASVALPRHPDGEPGHEGLFYDEMPRWKNPYLLCKWALDRQAREQARAGLPVVIGIPGMALGEFDAGPSSGRLITAIASGAMSRYVEGQRNVIDAGEAGRGLLLALEKGRLGERYLITGTNIEMAELTAHIARLLEVAAPTPMPLAVARGMAALQRLRQRMSGEAPKIDPTSIAAMAGGQFLDGAKAAAELGFQAEVALDDTLRRAIRWFGENGYL
ncbi:NAD-dependent epimerase/dehydratase family protein [Pseudomonas sp. TUM22785]|uniref:NAD-dependent epimerase/dehydratase family protein n=1 Tax=Pseudomonas sp. TUM22785 TaxID=3019098 RepID=UPI002304DEDF|nr:NAD-dependent epimerase/dehydratase family protein [Pseudomonas sp. TUM22785]WCD79554.1 NAD-dependent epimerase/dehydratase family protein [Pseudomonas sp. TUM22785]